MARLINLSHFARPQDTRDSFFSPKINNLLTPGNRFGHGRQVDAIDTELVSLDPLPGTNRLLINRHDRCGHSEIIMPTFGCLLDTIFFPETLRLREN